MSEASWNILPSVILSEIYSYLSRGDKICASMTCKNWRYALGYPHFGSRLCWRKVHFVIKLQDNKSNIERTRFLINCAARKLQKAIITFDSMDVFCVKETSNVLKHLSESVSLKALFLKPTNCSLACPDDHDQWSNVERLFGYPLILAVQKCRRLEILSLGCLEEVISAHANIILDNIADKHSDSISVLGLASLKDNPDNYLLSDINTNILQSMKHLQILSIDYCNLNDNLLNILSSNCNLQRLVVHVHGILEEHPGTSENAWSLFTHNLPGCELRLTLIHSYDGVDVLHSNILKRAMPLTHLKVFFCEKLNVEAVHFLSFYSETLKSIWWVDSMSCSRNENLIKPYIVNPFIMCRWRCQGLEEIVFLGHKYFLLDAHALIRLQGNTLHTLCLAASNIVFQPEDGDPACALRTLQMDIGTFLKKPWSVLVEPQLHPVIWDSAAGDSDEFLLPIVLQDIEADPTTFQTSLL